MVTEQAAELEAGPALDAFVAERVMGLVPCGGWERGNLGSAGGPVVRKRCAHENGACYPTLTVGAAFGRVGGCPPYSSDIHPAWAVVNRMRERGIDVMLFQGERREIPAGLRDATDDLWECGLWWLEGGEHRETTQYAETAPLAICRAALRWVDTTGKESAR